MVKRCCTVYRWQLDVYIGIIYKDSSMYQATKQKFLMATDFSGTDSSDWIIE